MPSAPHGLETSVLPPLSFQIHEEPREVEQL